MSKINWFPGHMARTIRDIKEIKLVDLVIELVDARAIKASSNNELAQQIQKPRITIAVKGDLSDIRTTNNILVCSLKDNGTRKKIIEALYSTFKQKIDKYKAKGLLVPQFYILIVGMPNIGKSSLINYLSKGSKLIVENRPGVTRRKQLIKINDNFLLYDTPGVMVKKIDDDSDGFRLGLINAISQKVIPMEETIEWAFDYLNKNYQKQFESVIGVKSNQPFDSFINDVCTKYKFITHEGKNDDKKCYDYLLGILQNNPFKINWEK